MNRINESNEVNYFKAHVYFKLNQVSKSNEFYTKAYSNEKTLDKREHIEWYQLLNNLACGMPCNKIFNESLERIVSNTKHKHYFEAMKLKSNLK